MRWIEEVLGFGQGPQRIERSIYSPELGRFCTIRILVPTQTDGNQRLPVVYAQDGQHLFQSFASPRSWRIDEALRELSSVGRRVVLVGIDHGGARRVDEYSPFEDEQFGGGMADHYVRFLTDTLKPWIDEFLPVSLHPDQTVILGSSLGGLAALFAKFSRPDVFGAAVVLSPAVSFADSSLDRFVERQDARGRIHLGVGTLEFDTGSAEYVRRVRSLGQKLAGIGYEPGVSLSYAEVRGGTHGEQSWGDQLPSGLDFALGNTPRTWAPLRRPTPVEVFNRPLVWV